MAEGGVRPALASEAYDRSRVCYALIHDMEAVVIVLLLQLIVSLSTKRHLELLLELLLLSFLFLLGDNELFDEAVRRDD